jgi:hypothetical protein
LPEAPLRGHGSDDVSPVPNQPPAQDPPTTVLALWYPPTIYIPSLTDLEDVEWEDEAEQEWVHRTFCERRVRWHLTPDLLATLANYKRAQARRRTKRAVKRAYEQRRLEAMDARRKAGALPKRLQGPSRPPSEAVRTTVRGARPPIPPRAFS